MPVMSQNLGMFAGRVKEHRGMALKMVQQPVEKIADLVMRAAT